MKPPASSSVSSASLVSPDGLKAVGYTVMGLSVLLMIGRYTIRGLRRRLWQWEDSFVLLAWCCFIPICIDYIVVIPAMFRILKFEADGYIMYPEIVSDGVFLTKIFFPNTLLFWCCLWFVKFSFLAQAKRLIARQKNYIIAWWCILAFTIITFIGCVASEFTSCRTLSDWFTFGQCSTPRDARAAIISLYYAFAVDVVTDLLIIVLPFRILWNLQITRAKKARVLSFFGVVGLGVSAAVVRVIAINEVSANNQPSPSWLALWAMVETFIAVFVACMPAYGLLFTSKTTPSKGYDYGYTTSGLSNNKQSKPSVRQESYAVHDGSYDAAGSRHQTVIESGSLEYLNDSEKGIMMTTTIDAHSSPLSSLRPGSDTSASNVGQAN